MIIHCALQSLLLDCLVYPLGPRVRDRVSHGEVDLSLASLRVIAQHLICVCCALTTHLRPDSMPLRVGHGLVIGCLVLVDYGTIVDCYRRN